MKLFETFLVDDREDELIGLKELLDMRQDIFKVKATATSFNEAIQILNNDHFDLSIIDNLLDNNHDVLDLLKAVNKKNLGIIAVTSIEALQLVDKSGAPYFPLLIGKPHTAKRINKFINDLFERCEAIERSQGRTYNLRGDGVVLKILLSNVLFFEASEKYTKVYFENAYAEKNSYKNPFLHDEMLQEVERNIDSKDFYRSHRSYLINTMRMLKGSKEGFKLRVYFADENGFLISNPKFTALVSREAKKYLVSNNILDIQKTRRSFL